MRKSGASSAPLSRHVRGMSDESDRGCLMNRIGDDFLTGEKTVSVGRSRRRFARRHATVHGRTHHKIPAGAGESLRGDSAFSQSDSFAPSLPRPPPSTSSTPGVTPAVEVLEVEGGYLEVPGQSPPHFVACPTCTFHNRERCSACGVALFE